MLYAWKKGKDKSDVKKLLKEADGVDFEAALRRGLYGKEFGPCAAALRLWVSPGHEFEPEELADMIDTYGPIWVAGEWNAAKHVIVVVGAEADSDLITLIDPWLDVGGAEELERPITWFNRGRGSYLGVNGSVQVNPPG
jgi:hypothetical protein